MPALRLRSRLAPLRSAISGSAARARRAINPDVAITSEGDVGSAGSLLQESFVRRLERLNVLTKGLVRQGVAGEHRSRRHASSVEFADFRKYVPGDDFRRVDWNAYARLGGLFLRLTEAKEDVPVHLLVDCSQSMNWGTPNKLAFARRLAAAIGYLALARFDAVSGATFAESVTERFPLVRGKNQATRLLSYLDRGSVGRVTRIGPAMAQYCGSTVGGGIAFLISDLHSEDDWQQGILRLIREGMDVVVVHVLAPQELEPPLDGEIELLDSETGDVVELVVGDEARRSYGARVDEWCHEVEDFCHRSEVRYLRLNSAMQLEEIFLNLMRRRRIVR